MGGCLAAYSRLGVRVEGGWNGFQARPGVLRTFCPRACAWGGAHSRADALPARRALPHFLSCASAWVRSDWHGPVPAQL